MGEVTFRTEPGNTVERVANAALDAAAAAAEREGVDIENLTVMMNLVEAPEGEQDGVTTGIFNEAEPTMEFLLGELLYRAQLIATQLGYRVQFRGVPAALRRRHATLTRRPLPPSPGRRRRPGAR